MSEANNSNCENCGHAVLSTDATCWHCGWHQTAAANEPFDAGSVVQGAVPASAIPYTGLAVYSFLTLVITIALLLVMGSLGRRPLVVPNSTVPLKSGWVAVVDRQRQFAFNLPADWTWEERIGGAQLSDFDETLIGALPFQLVVSPYGEIPKEMLMLVAAVSAKPTAEDPAPPFALIARDVRASHLKPDEAIAVLQANTEEFEILRASLTRESSGESRGAALVKLVAEGYQCEQKLINVHQGGLLIAACAPTDRYFSHSDIMQAIVDSFEIVPG